MKQKSIFTYLAAYLVLLIPTPGRFVYGMTLMLELVVLMFLGTLISIAIDKLKLKELKTVIILFSMLVIAVIYRQIFIMLQPEIVLTLGFTLYLVPISTFLISFLFKPHNFENKEFIVKSTWRSVKFALCGLIFFLIRDILGFGTFTFFGPKHQIFEKVLFNENSVGILSFLATIPGALLLSSLITYFHLTIKKKFTILDNVSKVK